jgi:type IV secretion system protein VirD4
MVISQTIGLLRAVYPQTCDSFLTSHLSIFFGTTDLKTAELVSTSLGKMTVQSHSENKGQSKQENKKFGSFAVTSDSTTSSYSETGRSLLNPDEVRRLDSKVLIAFLRGENPILLQRLTYLTHPHYKGRFEENFLHKA